MTKKQIIKAGTVLAVVVIVAGISLAFLTDTSAAQGPGGRGRNGAGGGNGPAQGTQTQTRAQIDPACCDQTGPVQIQAGARGNGNGYRGGGMGGGGQFNGSFGNLPPAVPGEVPASVVEALTDGWLDEYNAYMTYQAVIDQFGPAAPFVNIQRAEAQHMAALEMMFARYALDVPAAPALEEVPSFVSLADACATAQATEIANAALYDQWMATVQNYPDMLQVFTALRDASLNQHLPAFERCAG